MVLKRVKTKNKFTVIYQCPKCEYESKAEKLVREDVTGDVEPIRVVGANVLKLKTMPTTSVECPKCANETAYWWMNETRSLEEAPTEFYRCTNCGHTWRSYT